MQIALRPYVSASVAMIGAGLIAITPVVVAPDTEQRALQLASIDVLGDLEGMLSTLGSEVLSAFNQDAPAAGVILAGLIDPDLAGAPAQAADTAAATDLGTAFATALSDADTAGAATAGQLAGAEGDINNGDFFDAWQLDGAAAPNAIDAMNSLSTAEADAAQAVIALSAADPIQVFEADVEADFSQLITGQGLSATTIGDLIATLNAAPAAAQEAIALVVDPAAAGQVTAYEDANMAAEAATTAAQQYQAAAIAAGAAFAGNPTDMMQISNATSQAVTDVSAASTASGDVATSSTDAVHALATLTPGDVSAELDALGSAALAQLDALGSTVWTDLQTLGTDVLGLF